MWLMYKITFSEDPYATGIDYHYPRTGDWSMQAL